MTSMTAVTSMTAMTSMLTAHEDDLPDLALVNLSVLQALGAGFNGALDQIRCKQATSSRQPKDTCTGCTQAPRPNTTLINDWRPLPYLTDDAFKLGAGELHGHVLGSRGVDGNVRKVDVSLHGGGQLNLGLFSGFAKALQSHLVLAEIDALVLLELSNEVVHKLQTRRVDESWQSRRPWYRVKAQPARGRPHARQRAWRSYSVVKVLAAQEGITVGGLDLKDATLNLQDGDIKRATSQIIYHNPKAWEGGNQAQFPSLWQSLQTHVLSSSCLSMP